jgi:hypothetical protein
MQNEQLDVIVQPGQQFTQTRILACPPDDELQRQFYPRKNVTLSAPNPSYV